MISFLLIEVKKFYLDGEKSQNQHQLNYLQNQLKIYLKKLK